MGATGATGPTGAPGPTGAGPTGGSGPAGVAIAYGRVDGTVAVGADGLQNGAVGVTSAIRQTNTAFVTLYQLSFAAGLFSGTPSVVVTPESVAPANTGEDNTCVVEAPSATQVTVACGDLSGNGDLQRPDATVFAFIAIGPP
jgi:hypothetical protein